MAVADVNSLWEKMRGFAGAELFGNSWTFFASCQQTKSQPRLSRWPNVRGFHFSSEEYRAAIVEGIKGLPATATSDRENYRRMVDEGRWFEVVDGVVVGG
jgi:hypothetical protein